MKKIFLLSAVILSTVFLAGCGEVKDANADGYITPFAQCVTEKGLKMYGTDRCPHCKNMKEMFGSAFSGVNFINCETSKVQCDAAGIVGYPTRSFNGTKYEGEKTLEELAQITSCIPPVATAK